MFVKPTLSHFTTFFSLAFSIVVAGYRILYKENSRHDLLSLRHFDATRFNNVEEGREALNNIL